MKNKQLEIKFYDYCFSTHGLLGKEVMIRLEKQLNKTERREKNGTKGRKEEVR